MAKCTVCLDYDNKLNPVEPCSNTGWPELDDLCPDHFREYIVGPAQAKAFAEQLHADNLQHRLYLVEVSMGLRPKPYLSTVGDSGEQRDTQDDVRLTHDKHVTERDSPLSRRVRPSFASQIEIDEDFKEEME